MNICFASKEYSQITEGGGLAMYAYRMSQALVRKGHAVSVVALIPDLTKRSSDVVEDGGVRVYLTVPGNIHWYVSKIPLLGKHVAMFVRELEYSFAVWRKVREIHGDKAIDIIESSETSNLFLTLFAPRIPLVIRLHGDEYTFSKETTGIAPLRFRLARILQRISLRRAALLTSPSEYHASEIRRELGRENLKIRIIPNPLIPLPSAKKTKEDSQGKRVLYVGRLEPRKGLWVLLDAAQRVFRENNGIRFVLAGAYHPSVTPDEIARKIQEAGLSASVDLPGHLNPEALARAYQDADIFIMPSYYETFSMSCVEAMSFAKPVIATRVGGLPEVVQDLSTGLLVSPGDPQAIASAILRLAKEDDLRESMGREAQIHCRSAFSLEKVLAETVRGYQSVQPARVSSRQGNRLSICFQTIDYALPEEGGGGISVYINTLLRPLLALGHRVIVLGPSKDGKVSKAEENGILVYRVPLGNLHWYVHKIPLLGDWLALPIREWEWGWAFWKGFRQLVATEPIDILEGSEVGNVFHALRPTVPMVIRLHGDTYTFRKFSGKKLRIADHIERQLQRWCFRRATLLTAPSSFQAREVEQECKRSVVIKVIPNPVDPFWFVDDAKRDTPKEGRQLILYSGRIEHRKGTLVLLRAIRHVLKEMPETEFWIAGGRHESIDDRLLDEVIREEGIASHLKILGCISQGALKEAYEQCALFVMPSYYETFSISCAEAMACGKPVVAARGSALPEVIDEGRTGLLVPTGDAEALARAIVTLLKDPSLRRDFGKNGRKKVEAYYQAEMVAGYTVQAYEEVLKDTTRGA